MYIAVAKVIFDFYGNDELRQKTRVLYDLTKDLHRVFNVSATQVEDFDDLERGVLGVSATAATELAAKSVLKKALEHIDRTSPARVVLEETDIFGYE